MGGASDPGAVGIFVPEPYLESGQEPCGQGLGLDSSAGTMEVEPAGQVEDWGSQGWGFGAAGQSKLSPCPTPVEAVTARLLR